MRRLDGKVALITGGARGQGRAIAVKFASEGANIAVCDICRDLPTVRYGLATEKDLQETVELVEEFDQRCLAQVADVRQQSDMDRMVEATIHEFGRIDILVANAGIVDFKPFWEISEEEWLDQIHTNLTGVWHVAKSVAPHMIAKLAGCMVFTSSSNGVQGGVNYAHYIAAKHGVLGLMKGIALELGPYGIRVNAVIPGSIDTPMNDNPINRDRTAGHANATRDEYVASVRRFPLLRGRGALPASAIADAMIWLASEESSNVTGIELVIDAGHLVLPGLNLNPIVENVIETAVPNVGGETGAE